HVLLGVGIHKVVELQPGDGEHGHAIELGIVEAVEQVNAARSRGRQAAAEPPRPFRVAAGHEGGRLLVAGLDEADLVLALAQGLHDSVDAVPRQPEDDLHAPLDQAVDQDICCRFGHVSAPSYLWLGPGNPRPASKGMPATRGNALGRDGFLPLAPGRLVAAYPGCLLFSQGHDRRLGSAERGPRSRPPGSKTVLIIGFLEELRASSGLVRLAAVAAFFWLRLPAACLGAVDWSD